jgi:putative ABC transport system permease protein
LAGGLAGAALAWWAFDGFRAATLNFSSFSQVAFAFDVSASLLLRGIVFSLVIGLIGGLFPALRAARQPVAEALREQ